MLKKLFKAVLFLAFLSVACFVIVLCYNKPRALPFFTTPYVVNGSNTLTLMIKERVHQLWVLDTDAPEAGQMKLQTPPATNQTLEHCPDTPPDLLGPLHVDFNFKLTLDEVRQEFKSSLQKGGRYKAPDCISQHKVGEWMLGHLYIIHTFILFHLILIQSHAGLNLSFLYFIFSVSLSIFQQYE